MAVGRTDDGGGGDPGVPASYDVLGVRIDALTLDRAVALTARRIAERAPAYVSVCTVNDVVEALGDPRFAAALAGSWLATSDGMPLVWWGRLARAGAVERVYGPDLLRALLTDPRHAATRHFFYGGTDALLPRLVAAARRLNPDVRIAGTLAPPFRPLSSDEERETAAAIDAARPDVVWVGLGCPKQNHWMARFRPRLEAPLLIGVGAAFDFLAGVKTQAPRWMRRAGLEWSFRLAQEPRRLARRYLAGNSRFVFHAALHATGLARYPQVTSWP